MSSCSPDEIANDHHTNGDTTMTINTQTVSVSIAWREIHDRALVVDAARQGTSIGRDGVTDAFGGQYYPPWYESRGLAGLVSLVAAARRLQYDAWKAVHVAKDRLDAAAVEVASDADQRWSVVELQSEQEGHPTVRPCAAMDGSGLNCTLLAGWPAGMQRA